MDQALNVTLVGFTVVFVALILLSVIIFLFGKGFNAKKTAKITAVDNSVNTASVSEITENYEADAPADELSYDELVAVLTSAVLSSMRTRPDSKIRVKSFRRINQNSPAWNAAGRMEYIAGKL